MNNKILIGCYEIPGFGGANTASYKLFERMQRDGMDVCYINIIEEQDVDYFKYVFGKNYGNPESLPNVYNCILKQRLYGPHSELEEIILKLDPDVLIGKGFIAAFLMKKAAHSRKMIFITSSCTQVRQYIIQGKMKSAVDLHRFSLRKSNRLKILVEKERETVKLSDLVITHSDMAKYFFERFFPSYAGKIYSKAIWAAEWIYDEALNYSGSRKSFQERDIDILFIASAWSRPEKNYDLVKKITSKCKDLKIHIIGETEEKMKGIVYHGTIIKREELYSFLGRTKTVVCPSLRDSAPGILFEASAMGCNIIASKNCGNWRLCNQDLLVEPFHLTGFLKNIHLSLLKEYPDNKDYFLNSNSYQDLIDTIKIF